MEIKESGSDESNLARRILFVPLYWYGASINPNIKLFFWLGSSCHHIESDGER